jgi:hypothetical protein
VTEKEKGKPRPGPSVYEQRYLFKRDDEDRTEWVRLATTDPATGRMTWHHTYRAFNETPLSGWKPPQR